MVLIKLNVYTNPMDERRMLCEMIFEAMTFTPPFVPSIFIYEVTITVIFSCSP